MDDRPQQPVLAACRSLLRPIVRLLLRHRVMHREIADVLKELYVEVASREFGLHGRPTNISRTALLTGLDRKEVRRIRDDAAAPTNRTSARQDRLSRLLSGWHQDDEFSASGIPKRLPVSAAEGPSFARLAQRYGGDIPMTTLLKELKRAGAIVERDGELEARTRYFMPVPADYGAALRAGSVIADLGSTVVHNLAASRRTPPRFEGRATNHSVSPNALPKFRDLLERRGQKFLEELDDWLTAHEVPEGTPGATRLGAGLYWIEGSGDK